MSETVGRIAEVWRYPVKSMGGERLEQVRCTARGLEGDRRWAVRAADGKLGSGKSSRRFHGMRGLLSLTSFIGPSGGTSIRFPDGEVLGVEDPATARAVSRITGEGVQLVAEGSEPHFDQAPRHLLSAASLRWLAGLRPDDAVDLIRTHSSLGVHDERGVRWTL